MPKKSKKWIAKEAEKAKAKAAPKADAAGATDAKKKRQERFYGKPK